MPEMQVFENTQFGQIRTVQKDGETWFVAADVCRALEIGDAHVAMRRIDDDEKGRCLIPTLGGNQEINIVNEPGLYALTLGSRKPEAKAFKRWITHEVLPTVRQTGSYSVKPMTPAQLLAAQAQVLVDMEARMAQMETQAHALESKVDTAIKVFSRPSEDHWKEDMDKAIKELCAENGLSVLKTKGVMYEELERAVNCDVDRRLGSLRARSRKAGKRYKDAMALTKLDAIAADKSLRAVFEGIVRKWQSKHAAAACSEGDQA